MPASSRRPASGLDGLYVARSSLSRGGEAPAKSLRLLVAQRAQGNVHVAVGGMGQTSCVHGVARHSARALSMTNDPESDGPALPHALGNSRRLRLVLAG